MAAILDFYLEWFLLFLLYKSPCYFLPSFESTGPSFRRSSNLDFQDGCQLGFPIKIILAIFDPQASLKLPIKFRVSWYFHSGKDQNRFSRWLPSWFSKLFLICWSPWYFLPSFKSVGLSVQEEFNMDFQDGHLWFLTGPILAIFEKQVPTDSCYQDRVNWP